MAARSRDPAAVMANSLAYVDQDVSVSPHGYERTLPWDDSVDDARIARHCGTPRSLTRSRSVLDFTIIV